MKKKLFAGLLTATLCFAHLPVMAQSGQPDSGENRFHAFQEARQHHWWKTADMRQQVRLKMLELAAMMANPKSTEDELLKKQGELQGARAILEKEQLSFLYQMKQKYPEVVGSCGMSGHGMGMGPCGMGCGTMGRGHGMGHGAKGGHHMGDGMMGGHGIGTGPCGMGHCMMGGEWDQGVISCR
jgi:hypothetical protein